MLRHRFALVALIAASAACSDTPTYASDPSTPEPDGALQLTTHPGVLESFNRLRSGDRVLWLAGWQTQLFRDLVGAEVLIEGMLDTDPEGGLIIHEFQLLTVDGEAVLDGVLGAMEEGYYIRSREGYMDHFAQLPDGLSSYIGKRVWMTRDTETVRYGLLER